MIKDTLEYAETYYGLSVELKEGFEWLKSHDLKSLKAGKYFIGDNGNYVNIEEYETKEDSQYEAHKKFVDIQYIIKGHELIGVCDRQSCQIYTPYDEERDIEFLNSKESDNWIDMREGEFLVLYPHNAHKPSISPIKKQNVKKAVVKVRIN